MRHDDVIRARLDAIEAEVERLAGTDLGGDRVLYGRVTTAVAGTYPRFMKVALDRIDGAETAGGAATATATGGTILGMMARQPAANAKVKCYGVTGGYACKEQAAPAPAVCEGWACSPPEILYLTDPWGTVDLQGTLDGTTYFWTGCQDATFDHAYDTLEPGAIDPSSCITPASGGSTGTFTVRLTYSLFCPRTVSGPTIYMPWIVSTPGCRHGGTGTRIWFASDCATTPDPILIPTTRNNISVPSNGFVVSNCAGDSSFAASGSISWILLGTSNSWSLTISG
jgi:hypothetical protein